MSGQHYHLNPIAHKKETISLLVSHSLWGFFYSVGLINSENSDRFFRNTT